jgi:SAM-dependent methyltransferase
VTACPACGGPLLAWREVPGGEPSDPWRYPLLRCTRCGSAATGGEPPAPAAYEAGVYGRRTPRATLLVRAFQRTMAGQPVRLLRRAGLSPGARVLDAGAGTGRLVAELSRRGYDARGIDPAPRGPGVTRAGIADHEDRDLDAVLVWHVLEHLDDPVGGLRRIRSWLRPDGMLLVGVPNAASLQARIAGRGWLHWDVPRHRVHLTSAGLRALLDNAGFTPGRTAHMVWEHNPGSMWMALLARLGMAPGFPFHLLKRNIEPRARDLALLVAGLPLAPVAALLEGAAAAAGRGGTIAQLARPQPAPRRA